MVIKKARDFISFKFGDIQVLDIMKFLGRATSLERCCKWDKKKFFPYELFDSANKLENEELPPYEAFFSKLRNNNPLDRDFKDCQKLRSSGLDEQKVLKNFKSSQYPHLDGKITNINIFFAVIQQQRGCSNPWSNAKKVQFYHQKENDMLKLGCTLPNLANICLHKSNNEKFYPFCKIDRDLRQKIREDMTDGPSIVFSRKAVVDKIFIRDSSKISKSIVWIYESQFYPYSMCQDMPTWM